ncbi:ARID DNA-binding domain-containing protein [Tanacetum coccineum]|uniref:ARID DNA-binding domain-containing protein n=1 Tax=Tanacetum coccineum TaxID=301880 RepID=A0ABQ4WQ40_9ASTR
MLKRKLEEIELYNSAIPQTQSQTILQNRNRRQKCYKCRQRGHIIKNCPIKEKKHVDGTEKSSGTSETAETVSKQLMTAKPTVSLKYPEWIHFSTKCMIEGTDKGHWDEIWYISNDTNIHLCSKLNLFGNIKEKFAVRKLEDQMKFLFTYGLGEVVIINGDEKYLIPGVYYAPEVTLNILSVETKLIDEDKLRMMQNEYLEKYFESVEERNHSDAENKTVGLISMENDLIEIKGAIYSTKSYLERPIPGPIPPKINGVEIHLLDLYKLVESLGGYLSVHFAREFGKIGEILGLSIQDEEEVKKCYINYLDVFTCYYKTARVPKQEHSPVLDIPTEIVEEDKEYTCLTSRQCDIAEIKAPSMETANRKGKAKRIEHFGVKLEDINEVEDPDSQQFQNQQIRKTMAAPQVMILSSLFKEHQENTEDMTVKTYDLKGKNVGKFKIIKSYLLALICNVIVICI